MNKRNILTRVVVRSCLTEIAKKMSQVDKREATAAIVRLQFELQLLQDFLLEGKPITDGDQLWQQATVDFRGEERYGLQRMGLIPE